MSVKVINRNFGRVGYTVPEMHLHRSFAPGEEKNISEEELRQLSYLPGGQAILKDYLIVEDDDLMKELCGEQEPEYHYTEDDVRELLLHGSLDQLLDCLDFAPHGVIELVKDLAVKLKLNDVEKRDAIKEKTGFNVTKAIEINEDTEVHTQEEKPVRRSAPVTKEEEKPTRRYKIIQ
ncbi:MAG: hypothetical protein LUC37_02110 [Prevotella sp.]|nr:hypothetical protein [Prevotella sp.]